MPVLAYIIPLLTCLVVFLTKGDVYGWEIYLTILAVSSAVTGLVHYRFNKKNTTSSEFLGAYVTGVRHDDAWTEIRIVTEQRQVGTDRNGNPVYKEVKRKEYINHPDEYYLYTNTGHCRDICYDNYRYFLDLWQTEIYHDSISGGNIVGGIRYYQICQYSDILDRFEDINPFHNREVRATMIPYTVIGKYRNKVKNSNSIFKFENISKAQAEKYGLYDYPPIDGFETNPILGGPEDPDAQEAFSMLNAFYGIRHQITVLILFFDADKGVGISEKQRAYWKGGNKNEFVVCLGLDKDGKTVKWCNTFSWEDEPELGAKTKTWFVNHPQLDMSAFNEWLRNNLHFWKRKEFADFDYLKVSLTTTQLNLLFLITIAANILIGWIALSD